MSEPTSPDAAAPLVTPAKVGRRSVRTPERAVAIAEALGRGLPVTAACRVAGICPGTYHDWRAKDEDFAEQIEVAIARGISARLAIIERAASEDWRAAAWLLERGAPEHFSRNRVEHQHLHVSGDKVLIYLPAKSEIHPTIQDIHEIPERNED